MREERLLSSLKNTYRINKPETLENNSDTRFKGNQTMISLFLNRVKILLEEE